MILSSGTKKPKIHPSAYIAPTATISGDVTVGSGCAVLHGAVITAEGAPVTVGADTVIMEHAVVKASGGSATQFPVKIGERCIIGPHAYVVGATIETGCMIGSGAAIYNGLTLKAHTRVRDSEARLPAGDFTETVFNVEQNPDAGAKAALAYAQFLRKTHAQDTVLDAHANKAPVRRSAGDEPPKQQTTEVDTVVDAMMLELQEMELKRQEAMKKKPKQ
jgi:carbonic anhydrase/acetyltransferase-like protein (isoleucine patch superfamily)